MHILRCIVEPQAKYDDKIKSTVEVLCSEIWGEAIGIIKCDYKLILECSERISKQVIISSKSYHFKRNDVLGQQL